MAHSMQLFSFSLLPCRLQNKDGHKNPLLRFGSLAEKTFTHVALPLSCSLSSVWPLFCVSNQNQRCGRASGAGGETYGLMQLYLPLCMTGLHGIKEIKREIWDILMQDVITRSQQHVGKR